jgi:hypothetical protein
VVSGKSLSDAYKQSYNAERMSDGAVYVEASRLMANPKVTLKVEQLQRQKDRAVVASSLSDRERVLAKFRAMLDTTEGGPAVTAQLRAAELLGKAIGLFKEVQVQESPRSAEEVHEELERRLAALTDPAMH